MLVPTGALVHAAAARGVGICAFNVITLEHAEAIAVGAEAVGRPVIMQISENAVRYHGGRVAPLAAGCRAVAEAAGVEIALHLDHVTLTGPDRGAAADAPSRTGHCPGLWREAAGHGFGSVMVDASRLPYPGNVAATRAAVEFGHAHGLWVEAELGMVGGKPGDPHAPDARTDPVQAASYVEATGVDGLAVAVGSAHAMTSRDALLDQALIAALRAAVPVPLVLHGSSGVPDAELRRAVAAGIIKVNIGTALNIAFTRAVRDTLAAHPTVVDPRRYLIGARDAMAAVVAHFIRLISAAAGPTAAD
jgi:fructose-bisphosphate aldolase class II